MGERARLSCGALRVATPSAKFDCRRRRRCSTQMRGGPDDKDEARERFLGQQSGFGRVAVVLSRIEQQHKDGDWPRVRKSALSGQSAAERPGEMMSRLLAKSFASCKCAKCSSALSTNFIRAFTCYSHCKRPPTHTIFYGHSRRHAGRI